MPVTATITETDYSDYLHYPSVAVIDKFGKRGLRCRASFYIPSPQLEAGRPGKPRTGHTFRLEVDGEELFEGSIVTVEDEWVNPDLYEARIECVDFTMRLDAHKVRGYEFPAQAPGERVKAILDRFATDFGYGTIDVSGSNLPAEEYDFRDVSAVFDEIAEATDHHWYVDTDKKVHFIDELSETSPLSTAHSNTLDVDSNLEIGDVAATEDWSNLFNCVYITDFALRSDSKYSHEERADGRQKFFKLPMPPWDVESTEVYLSPDNGTTWLEQETFNDPLGAGGAEEAGAEDQCYVCIFNWGIRFPDANVPESGEILKTDFYYEKPKQVLRSCDPDSIAEMKEREGAGSDGIHERVVSLPDLRTTTIESAELYAAMLLDRGAWPDVRGSFTTFMSGWESGQVFELTSETRDFYGQPVDVWAQKVTKKIMVDETTGALVRTDVEFANKPFVASYDLDQYLHELVTKQGSIFPPGPSSTSTSTSTSTTTSTSSTSTTATSLSSTSTTATSISSTSTTTSTSVSTSTSTTTTLLTRAVLLEPATPEGVTGRSIEGSRISELDQLTSVDGDEEFAAIDDPSGTPVTKRARVDCLLTHAQVMFTVPGVLSTGDDQAPQFSCSNPYGLQFVGTHMVVKTPPDDSILQVDIDISTDDGSTWNSIYGDSGPWINPGSHVMAPGSGDVDEFTITTMEQGDLLRLNVDSVGSVTAGADLTVGLWVEQKDCVV